MSANDAQLASLYRLLLSQIYLRLAAEAPEAMAQRSSLELRESEHTLVAPPGGYLSVEVDGRETSYFEWLGAGLYSLGGLNGALNGRPHLLQELHYGFSEQFFYLRVDAFPEALPGLRDGEFRFRIRGADELRLAVAIEGGRAASWLLESSDVCLLGPHESVKVAFDKILEVAIGRQFFDVGDSQEPASLVVDVEFWQEGACMDCLPAEGSLEVSLGADGFAWPAP